MLTPAELKQIREYLMMYGKKDSQFRVLSELSDNDLIAFVRSHENFATHLTDIKDFIATAIADEGVYDSEGNPLVMSEENFTRILNEKLAEIQGGAQVNIIETVKVNNTALPVDTNKAVNIDLSDYITNDIVSEYASSTNKLVDKNYVDTSIAESSATFRGTSEAGLTEQEFLAWANTLTHDLNDYVFWKTLVTGSTDEYIYHRYKWDGTAWIYEYDLIPYYLDTDDYPASNSEKAVKSSGIFAFTGDVHKDDNNNYIPLQDQVDDVNGTIYNLHAIPSFVISPSSFLIKEGTVSPSSLSAVAKIEFNGVNESPNNYSVTLNNANWTATKNTTNNQYDCTRSSALTTAETVTATFTKGASYSKSISSTITAYYPIYYGVTNETSNPSNIVTSNYVNSVKSSTANTGYTVTTTTTNKYFFIAVPKVGGSVAEPSQYSLTARYDSPGTLTSLGTASIEINGVNITYKFFISAPQTATTSTYYTR